MTLLAKRRRIAQGGDGHGKGFKQGKEVRITVFRKSNPGGIMCKGRRKKNSKGGETLRRTDRENPEGRKVHFSKSRDDSTGSMMRSVVEGGRHRRRSLRVEVLEREMPVS